MSADKKDCEPLVFYAAPEAEIRVQWKVLIVDDEPAIHGVTRMVLNGLRFRERSLAFLSAYDSIEAQKILAEHDDIALILLDVVMETDDAGLKLVKHIRDVLHNDLVRIILRTGQAGQAPEREVILDYDINDYKEKTELTAQKLSTAVIAALRGYLALMQSRRTIVNWKAKSTKERLSYSSPTHGSSNRWRHWSSVSAQADGYSSNSCRNSPGASGNTCFPTC